MFLDTSRLEIGRNVLIGHNTCLACVSHLTCPEERKVVKNYSKPITQDIPEGVSVYEIPCTVKKLMRGLEPPTSSLPMKCSTSELHQHSKSL